MRCAHCRREESSVKLRDLPIGMFLCDDCVEFEKASREFRLNMDSSQTEKLYDRVVALSEKIEELKRAARRPEF